MNPLLSAVAHRALHGDPANDRHAAAAGHVLLALATRDPAVAAQHLARAQNQGAVLSQVGSLALYTDNAVLARVLAEQFNIKPEDYRTLGDEYGIDCPANYPTLALAAHHRQNTLQQRALAWGANPDATWKARFLGDHNAPPQKMSWVSANIRSMNNDMVDVLLAQANPAPDRAEQLRRLDSLQASTIRFSENYLADFRDLISRFAPQGPHALDVSPWDLPYHGTNLAVSRTSATTRRGDYDEMGRALAAFNPWIQATVPRTGSPHFDCLRACLDVEDLGFELPRWCVEGLSPQQAQELLVLAWSRIMPNWAKALSASNASWHRPDDWLSGQVRGLRPLVEIAQQAPPVAATWGPRFLLSQLGGAHQLSRLTEEGLDALLVHAPCFPGQPDPHAQVAELRPMLRTASQLRSAQAAARTDHAPDSEKRERTARLELRALNEEFDLVFSRLRLEAVAAQSRPTPDHVAHTPKMKM